MPKIVYFNLNLDDFHPQLSPDFGGDPERGTFKLLMSLLEEFPNLKITLFTVPNWIDRPRICTRIWYLFKYKLGLRVIKPYENEPFRIDKHPKWCNIVRSLVKEGRFEIAVHGYNHCNPYLYTHGQEFIGLSEREVHERILRAEELFHRCEIPFVKGFRPPGWGLSAELIRVLQKLNYKFIAPFPSHLRISKIGLLEGMLVPPSNYSISENPTIALWLAEEYGVVFAKGHMVYKYGREIIENGLMDKNIENLRLVLNMLNERYEVYYVTIEEYLSKFGGINDA
jgi:peptidoglycan/xylan/chitin deacetylase (PgdA/CDA1 family)